MPPTFNSPFQPNNPNPPKPTAGGTPNPAPAPSQPTSQFSSSFRPPVAQPPKPTSGPLSAPPTGSSPMVNSNPRPFAPPTASSRSQQSFIPKASLAKPLSTPQGESPMGGLLVTLSLIILAGSVAAWAAAWSYQKVVYNEINKPCPEGSQTAIDNCGLRESLKRQKERLGGEALNRIKRLEVKLATATLLLNSHATLVPLFDKLNSVTLKTIQYKKFDYGQDGTIKIDGVARSYEDIAVQSKVFNRERTIKSFLFSDLNAGQDGLITFKLAMTVAPELLSFVAASAIPVQGVPAPAPLATSTTGL